MFLTKNKKQRYVPYHPQFDVNKTQIFVYLQHAQFDVNKTEYTFIKASSV